MHAIIESALIKVKGGDVSHKETSTISQQSRLFALISKPKGVLK